MAAIRITSGTFDLRYASDSLKYYSKSVKPAVEKIIEELFEDTVKLERGTKLQIGVQMNAKSLKTYGQAVGVEDKSSATERAKKEVFQLLTERLSREQTLFTKFKLTATGDDVDILPNDLLVGKKIAVDFGLDLLRNDAIISNYLEKYNAKKIISSSANEKNCVIADDKMEFAGEAARELLSRDGSLVASGAADEAFLNLAKKFKGGIAKNNRISQLIAEMAYLLSKNKEKEPRSTKIIAIGETAMSLLKIAERDIRPTQKQSLPRIDRLNFIDVNHASEELLSMIDKSPADFVGSNLVFFIENSQEAESLYDFLDKVYLIFDARKIKYPQLSVNIIYEKHEPDGPREIKSRDNIIYLTRTDKGLKYNMFKYPGIDAANSNGVMDLLYSIYSDALLIKNYNESKTS